uniref:Uncharacterized protein n=1 Tax=Salmo trutta TaxID=8032 RepID=A0A674CCZ4_SALTR
IRRKVHPIVIDNTNLHKWEMWPYVRMVRTTSSLCVYVWCSKIHMEKLERMREDYEPVKKIWDVLFDYESRGRWMPTSERLRNHW